MNDDALVGASVTLRTRLIDYEVAEKTVRVAGPTVRADFLLDPVAVQLDELIAGEEDRARLAPAAATEAAQKASGVMLRSVQALAVRGSISGLPGRYNRNFHTASYARIEEVDQMRRKNVERARYEAELAERRYRHVDPDHRLVANALEADWNEKLTVVASTSPFWKGIESRFSAEWSTNGFSAYRGSAPSSRRPSTRR